MVQEAATIHAIDPEAVPDGFAHRERPADHPRAVGFVENRCQRDFRIEAPFDAVWGWLETPETFSEAQVWPFRVEYLDARPDVPAGFHEGGLNIHHGPLLCLPGRLDTIRETTDRAYRSLEYLYGAYVLSLRLIRPTRLEFWVDREADRRTRVRLCLSSDVHPLVETPWWRLQHVFWSRFPRMMARGLDARVIG